VINFAQGHVNIDIKHLLAVTKIAAEIHSVRSFFSLKIIFADQPRLDELHCGGIQALAAARCDGCSAVRVAYHGATAREYDSTVGGNFSHVLPGRGALPCISVLLK